MTGEEVSGVGCGVLVVCERGRCVGVVHLVEEDAGNADVCGGIVVPAGVGGDVLRNVGEGAAGVVRTHVAESEDVGLAVEIGDAIEVVCIGRRGAGY